MIQQKSDKNLASVPGILIAAPFSGSGKTTFTTGLLAALKKRTRSLYSYKCGPDYIDPMYHTRVLGIPCRNLDTWFTGEEKLKELFLHDPADAFHVVEGVMGLYDGVAGIRPEGSSYDLARVLGLPILLVVSAKGMGSSVIALIRGFLEQDRFGLIRGIFLNQISEEMYRRLKPELEKELVDALDNVKELVLDFEALDYLSSAGLRVLLSTQKRMSRQGSMKLVHVNDTIMEIFEVTGFTDILTIE